METAARFASDAYSLTAGPPSLRGYSLDVEPHPFPTSLDSQVVHAFAEYPVDEVLAAILALPGMRLLSEPGRRGACWAAAWEDGDRLILLEDFAEWDGLFGELKLRCDCRVTDVLELWESLRGQYPGLWLIGPESWLLSPAAFFVGYCEFDARWRTFDVLALARGIRADGAFDRLPILADALQDAGCNDSDILNHCRGRGPHAPGCWVVDVARSSTDHNRPITITSWENFLTVPDYGVGKFLDVCAAATSKKEAMIHLA